MSREYAIDVVRSFSNPFPGAYIYDEENRQVRVWSMFPYDDKNINIQSNLLMLYEGKSLFIYI
tara:strand:+ start:248 stop:436 length:189 start_codon:yes stop_codon:yes gene_type:complete